MSWWKRLFGRPDAPRAQTAPDWSGFTDAAAFEAFVTALEAALVQRGLPIKASIRADGATVAPGPGGADREILFWDLSAACAESPPATWPARIKDTTETLRAMMYFNRHSPVLEELYADISKLHTPGLILWGQNDVFLPFAIAERFAKDSGAILEVMPNASHLVWLDKPDEVARRMLDFYADD